MKIVPADPELHGHWIFSTFCAGSGEPREKLHRLLRTGAAKAAVMETAGGPNYAAAWAAVIPGTQTVVWAYSKWPTARSKGYMVDLLTHLGVDTTTTMYAMFPSPACLGLIRRGWPIEILPPALNTEPENDE